MDNTNRIAAAERASRGRAALMAIAAVVLVINASLQFDDGAYSGPGVRSASWIVLIVLWMVILATGGALARGRAMKLLIDDELSLRNRARALSLGFYVTIAAALLVYAAGWFTAIGPQDALRLVTAAGVSGALARYAWLETR